MSIDLWTREELIVALNLYWKIPYNSISGSSNAEIKRIAPIIGRTPGALAFKLMNLTSLDPERQDLGNKGKSGAGKLDRIIWKEYEGQWERLTLDSAEIIARRMGKTIEEMVRAESPYGVGLEGKRLTTVRLNQDDFRDRILASYNETCCITGINQPALLEACHIVPWSVSITEALNPKNGLCMTATHHRAFDLGMFTINSSFKIQVSKYLKKEKNNEGIQRLFLELEGKDIQMPDRFVPAVEFLNWHHHNRFQK
jgi:putative restriction endonuclease